MRGLTRLSLLGGMAALLSVASRCAAPTAIAVDVYTDLPCDPQPVAVVAGASSLPELGGVAASAASVACDATSGRLGRLVVLPRSGDRVAFTVATRVGVLPRHASAARRRRAASSRAASSASSSTLPSRCASISARPARTCPVRSRRPA